MKKKLLPLVMLVAGMCILGGCGKKSDINYTEEGYAAVIAQDYASAVECFNDAIENGEDKEMAYRGLGLTYMGAEEYGKAVNSFRLALANGGMFPGDLEYDINYYMAIAYYKLGEYDSAIEVYDGIIGLCPKDSNAFFMRGSMKTILGLVDDATADFDNAVAIDKNNYSLYIDIYALLKENGYEQNGQKYLDVVMAADTSAICDYDKGRLCYYQGEYAQGCNYLERARKNGESGKAVINLLAECYKQTDQYEYAAVIYSTYLATNADPEMYNQLGLCYVEQGDYQSALAAFSAGEQIIENNTCMQTLILNEVACYEYMLDFSSAKQKLEEYRDVYGFSEKLEKEYAFLTTR